MIKHIRPETTRGDKVAGICKIEHGPLESTGLIFALTGQVVYR